MILASEKKEQANIYRFLWIMLLDPCGHTSYCLKSLTSAHYFVLRAACAHTWAYIASALAMCNLRKKVSLNLSLVSCECDRVLCIVSLYFGISFSIQFESSVWSKKLDWKINFFCHLLQLCLALYVILKTQQFTAKYYSTPVFIDFVVAWNNLMEYFNPRRAFYHCWSN